MTPAALPVTAPWHREFPDLPLSPAAANVAGYPRVFTQEDVPMPKQDQPEGEYPHGRGYGHDYMRGGEVFDRYGHVSREEFDMPRGELKRREERRHATEG
ncbi:MAG: hypothetical protein ACK53W_15705 [Gemmatimonadota bacterium]